MTVLFAAVAVVSILAGFVERRSIYRAVERERRDWTVERAALVNREPVRPVFDDGVETFQPPVDDPEFWEANQN